MGWSTVRVSGDYNINGAINKGLLTKEDFEKRNNNNYVLANFQANKAIWMGDPTSLDRKADNVFVGTSVIVTESPRNLISELKVVVVERIPYKEDEKYGYGYYTSVRKVYDGGDALNKYFYSESTGKFYCFVRTSSEEYYQSLEDRGYIIKGITTYSLIRAFEDKTLDEIGGMFDSPAYLFTYKEDTTDSGDTSSSSDSSSSSSKVETTSAPNFSLTNTGATSYFKNTQLYSSYGDKFKCYITIKHSDTEVAKMGLPIIPQEFSDNNTGSFTPTQILGRSVAYQTYSTSSRSVSLSLTLHDELVNSRYKELGVAKGYEDEDYDYIHLLVSTIESACYPGYNSNGFVNPPSVVLEIGDQLYIEGIVTSVSTNWNLPIIDGKYNNCTLNLSITETSGPFSGNQISDFRGYRK